MSNNFYTDPSYQRGGYTVYGGYRRQRGAGVFGSFRNFMAPIGRQALSGIKNIARNKTVQNLAKQAAAKGAEVLTGVAVDALQGRNIGESFKQRGKEAVINVLTGDPPASAPSRKRKRGKKLKQKKRLPPAKQQKKRLPPAKQTVRGPPSKKRRKAKSRAALNRKNLF